MVKDTCPGMTLVAPGAALMVPTVPTSPPSSALQKASMAAMHSAAPASASRRSAIGTVPACPAMPVRLTARRVAPAIAVTTPTARFFLLQHRPLLDMQFHIGVKLAAGSGRCADMLGVETELRQRLTHRHAGPVARIQHALVKGSRDRPAAEQRGRKPHALLVGKTDDLDRIRQPPPPPVQVGDAGDRRDHAERAVPFAGVAHGVVVRSQHQARQAGKLAFIAAADIADRILMRAHAGVAHPCRGAGRPPRDAPA